MSSPKIQYMNGTNGRLAYVAHHGRGPCVVFLGGFRSDMTGTKALALEAWARREGRAFLRFDYTGHGESDGVFQEGAISDWLADAREVIAAQAGGKAVLVGSSMGGWIALLLARDHPEIVAGLVTIAAAPDFTQQGFEAGFDDAQRDEMSRKGHVELATEYGPLIITQRLIEDGRENLVLETPLSLSVPLHMLQGSADEDVPVSWAMRLFNHVDAQDLVLSLVKGADHRFSDEACLARIEEAVADMWEKVS